MKDTTTAHVRAARNSGGLPSRLAFWLLGTIFITLLLLAALARYGQRGPLLDLYERYSKWRYHWKAPADVGSGGPARAALIEDPMGLGEDQAGNLYVSDRGNRFIWKIDPSERATVVAGNGQADQPREDVPALSSPLGSPEGLVVDRAGNVIFVDSLAHLVLKLDRTGRLRRIAGTGLPGDGGDGGPAPAALLKRPYDVRLDSRGNLFIADFANHRIRRIDARGFITTVAGTGTAGYTGDGGPATQAQLNGPYGIWLDAQDNLLIADSQNHVIRRVGADGVITTIAGTGQPGYAGDGGPARAGRFDTPQSLCAAPSGVLYINDEHNHAIRRVERAGTLSTWLGQGQPGFAGDGGTRTEVLLNDPENIWVRRDGSLLITDGDNGRVRRLGPDGRVSTIAGRGISADHIAEIEWIERTLLAFSFVEWPGRSATQRSARVRSGRPVHQLKL
jgi:sugar lactone lactonase YvrE